MGNSAIPVTIAATGVGRYAAAVEATAYFCCLEAVQNAAKHSGASGIRVSLDGGDSTLGFVVEDDGIGFDPSAATEGTGLANLRDRIESAGGTITTDTAPGGGTRIRAWLPAPDLSTEAALTAGGG